MEVEFASASRNCDEATRSYRDWCATHGGPDEWEGDERNLSLCEMRLRLAELSCR